MQTLRVKTAQPKASRELNIPIPGDTVTAPAGAVLCGMRLVVTPEMMLAGGFGAKYGLEVSSNNGPWTRAAEGGLPIGTHGIVGQAAGMEPGELPLHFDLYDFEEPDEGSSGAEYLLSGGNVRLRVWIQILGGNGGGPVRAGSIMFFRDVDDQFLDF